MNELVGHVSDVGPNVWILLCCLVFLLSPQRNINYETSNALNNDIWKPKKHVNQEELTKFISSMFNLYIDSLWSMHSKRLVSAFILILSMLHWNIHSRYNCAVFISVSNKRIDQLKLALAWNRVDVANEEIFTSDAKFEVRTKLAIIPEFQLFVGSSIFALRICYGSVRSKI